MNPIEKLISVAKEEVGYIEKNSINNLYDKNLNIGFNNYTKYWQDIEPKYQGYSWCAVFVNWCFLKSFGKENTKKLLRHYPYIYVSTLIYLFELNEYPSKGDVVLFNYDNKYSHTGIVTNVMRDYFETVEGNTNICESFIPNGGGVCERRYFLDEIPNVKFCTPDWEKIQFD